MRNTMQVPTLSALALTLALGGGAPESPVADAAQDGDTELVRALVRDGADVNAAQADGMTALHWAAVNDDATTMQVLLYAGANREPSTRLGSYTPLHLASRSGHADVVRLLVEAGSDVNALTATGVAPLHFAAEAGDAEAIEFLVAHGADVNARDTYAGRTPLMFATARNSLDAIDALIAAGADVSVTTTVKDYPTLAREDGKERARRTRIQRASQDPQPRPAAAAQRPAAAQTAAPRQAATAAPDSTQRRAQAEPPDDPDRPTTPPEPDRPTPTPAAGQSGGTTGGEPRPLSYNDLVGKQGGFSALHYAARDGHIDAIKHLLEAGADVNQLTEGDHSSPLLVATINGNFDLAMKLLEWGADPNLVSEDGAGPLFAAINIQWSLRTWYPQPTAFHQQETTYLQLMERLLEAGADPNAQVATHIWYAAYNAGRMGVDFAGATAFWRAAYGLDVDAMKLLVAHGADPNIWTIKPAGRTRYRPLVPDTSTAEDSTDTDDDPSGLPPVPPGGPGVHPLHAASGVGYGTSRVGQQHRHVPDGWLPAVRYLVEELGVDVNLRDYEGYSAVHNAAARGDNATIEFLVEHGADVTVVSRRGQTTVDMANGPQQRVQPFPETIALLESLGAKNNHNCQSCE